MIAVPLASRGARRIDLTAVTRWWVNGSVFAIGYGMIFTVSIVGMLPVAELFSLGWVAWILLRRAQNGRWPHPLLGSATLRGLWIALALSFFGYVVADLVRGTAYVDLLRGWARLAFLGVDILALTYLLARDWTLLRWLVSGFIAGVVFSVMTVGPHADDYWKFGFAYPISFLLPMLVPQRRTWLLCALLAALGALHLYLGARSLGAVCLLAAATLWLPLVGRKVRVAALLASVVGAFFAIQHLYEKSGGAERAAGSTTERAAMLAFAGEAVRESPWIGQGSWFTKGQRVEAFFARRAEFRDEMDRVNQTDDDEVVIHSQILVALAEGGLFGGAFFFFLAWLLVWSLGFTATHDFTLRPLVLVLLLNGTWDLFMSPFSGSERVFIGLSCAMAVALRGLPRKRSLRP